MRCKNIPALRASISQFYATKHLKIRKTLSGTLVGSVQPAGRAAGPRRALRAAGWNSPSHLTATENEAAAAATPKWFLNVCQRYKR